MHIVSTSKGDVTRSAMRSPPFGPDFELAIAEKADRLEVWGSSFSDPGPDFCEFRLFKGDEQIGTKRVDGY